MTKQELFKMIKMSNIKRKDIVLDCGQVERRYTAIIEGLRVNHESDGVCRPHLSVYEFINMVKREYIADLIYDEL